MTFLKMITAMFLISIWGQNSFATHINLNDIHNVAQTDLKYIARLLINSPQADNVITKKLGIHDLFNQNNRNKSYFELQDAGKTVANIRNMLLAVVNNGQCTVDDDRISFHCVGTVIPDTYFATNANRIGTTLEPGGRGALQTTRVLVAFGIKDLGLPWQGLRTELETYINQKRHSRILSFYPTNQ